METTDKLFETLLAQLPEDAPETRDAVVALEAVMKSLGTHLADGADLTDAVKVIADVMTPVSDALAGAGQIDNELSKFTGKDLATLGQCVAEALKNMSAAYKAAKPVNA